MASLTEFYCRWNETSHASQFKWLDNTFKQSRKFNRTLVIGKARGVHLNNLIILSKFFCPKTFNFFEFTDPKECLPSAGFCLETTQFDVA